MIGITLRRVAKLEAAGYQVSRGVDCPPAGSPRIYWTWSERGAFARRGLRYPTPESAWNAANRHYRAARVSFALGYLAGMLDQWRPGRDLLLSWAGRGGAARDGFDRGVDHA